MDAASACGLYIASAPVQGPLSQAGNLGPVGEARSNWGPFDCICPPPQGIGVCDQLHSITDHARGIIGPELGLQVIGGSLRGKHVERNSGFNHK